MITNTKAVRTNRSPLLHGQSPARAGMAGRSSDWRVGGHRH